MYNNIDKWKSDLRKIALDKRIDLQDLQQRYVLEEFVRKISKSKYKNQIAIKGGFVISALIGIDERKTRDVDFTFCSTIYNKNEIEKIINDIIATKEECFFNYELINIIEEQLDDKYKGYSCNIDAIREKTRIHFKLDISNNTLIFPDKILTSITSLFDNEKIEIMSYPIENIIAEKYETTLDRGVFNSRMRDLIDIYLIYKENIVLINKKQLAQTIIEVSNNRNTYNNLLAYDSIINILRNSNIFNNALNKYVDNHYANKISDINEVFNVFDDIYFEVKKYL